MNECDYCGDPTEAGKKWCPICDAARKCVGCGEPTGDEAADKCIGCEIKARDAREMEQSRLEAMAEDAAEARREMVR